MKDDKVSGELIDLQGYSLSELWDEVDASAVKTAVERLLSEHDQVGNHGFNQYI